MTHVTSYAPAAGPLSVPVAEIMPWAVFGGLVMFVLLYVVGFMQGPDMFMHEFVHDSRHLLGFPCH